LRILLSVIKFFGVYLEDVEELIPRKHPRTI
jgi:hypothetical protein